VGGETVALALVGDTEQKAFVNWRRSMVSPMNLWDGLRKQPTHPPGPVSAWQANVRGLGQVSYV
jgi:hypothetical protein